MSDAPATTDEVTAEYVTDALRESGVIGSDTAVAELDHQPIGEGVGIVGQLARLTLRYDGMAEGAPSSLVAKLPSQYPENRAVGDHFDFYGREGRFYQQIGGKATLRIPRCFHNHMDPERGTFVLLLEDLGGRTLISQVAGMPAERASEALEAIALLHAAWWDSPGLDALTWMPRISDPVNLSAGERFRQAWPAFLEGFGDVIPDGSVAVGERVKDRWEQVLLDTVDRRAPTLCHGDFRADNLMFDDRAEGWERVAVLDWQIAYRGPAMGDVSYLISQSLDVEVRRHAERDLIEQWCDAVAAARGATPEGCTVEGSWFDHRQGLLTCLVYPVVSGGTMDPANERGRQLVERMAERAFTAVLDLDAVETLPD